VENKIQIVELPKVSVCTEYIGSFDFQDCYTATLSNAHKPIEDLYIDLFANGPKWIEKLLGLRSRIVEIFGLDTFKEAGEMARKNLRVGEKRASSKYTPFWKTKLLLAKMTATSILGFPF